MYLGDSFYIIKPDGMRHREEIYRRINDDDLEFDPFFTFQFNEELLNLVYPNLLNRSHGPLVRKYMMPSFFYPARCEFGFIHGLDGMKRFRELTGEKTFPEDCKDGTIRKDLGSSIIVNKKEGLVDIRNVIHRPVSDLEAAMFLTQFFKKIDYNSVKKIPEKNNIAA